MNEFHKLKSTLTKLLRQTGELWLTLVLTNAKFFGNLPFIRPRWEGYKKMSTDL